MNIAKSSFLYRGTINICFVFLEADYRTSLDYICRIHVARIRNIYGSFAKIALNVRFIFHSFRKFLRQLLRGKYLDLLSRLVSRITERLLVAFLQKLSLGYDILFEADFYQKCLGYCSQATQDVVKCLLIELFYHNQTYRQLDLSIARLTDSQTLNLVVLPQPDLPIARLLIDLFYHNQTYRQLDLSIARLTDSQILNRVVLPQPDLPIARLINSQTYRQPDS